MTLSVISIIVAAAILTLSVSVAKAARKERQRAAIADLERRVAEYEGGDQ